MSRLRPILLALGLLLATTEARAAGISISVNGLSFLPQQTVTVSFFAVGFGQATAPSIRSYIMTLTFDPAILEVQSIAFGDPTLGNQLDPQALGTLQSPVFGDGFATVDELAAFATTTAALDANQADTFILARVNLRPIGTGFGVLSGVVSGVRDGDDQLFTDLQNTLAISFQVVPEPRTALLVGAGGLVLGAARRRR